ncbi:MAG: cytochrome c, partial [Bacteroidota bacterium]|nr:cytochrome c [Bacteroidota bacterium]
AYGIAPSGDTIRLTHIPQWDFRWQENYRFKHLVRIPRGTRLYIEGTYDNTANNPFNPNNPPRLVMSSGDMRATDEMLTLMMIFLPYKEGDENLSIGQ